MAKKKIYKKKGMQISISPEAHKKMRIDMYNVEPKRTFRQHINIINNLSINI